MNQTTKSSVVLLAFAGLGSALLSVMIKSAHNFELFFVGSVFGISLASYFVMFERQRNPAKIAGFVCACTAAFAAALFSGFWLEPLFLGLGSIGSEKPIIPLPVFFGAGVVGAIIVFSAGVLLFGPRNVGWKSLSHVLLWSIGGGILGLVGGAADAIRTEGTYNQMLFLFLLWQPGVAILLGLLLRQQRQASLSTSTRLSQLEPSVRSGIQILSVLFFACVIGFLGFLGNRTVQSARTEAQKTAARERALREAPSIADLPPVKSVPPEQALIVREVDGLFPGKPGSMSHGQQSSTVPDSVNYSIGYGATKDPVQGSIWRVVAVEVTQLPAAAWANYRVKYPMLNIGIVDDSRRITKITEFGQIVLQNSHMRYPNGEGTLCFLWPSSVFVISVCYETPRVDKEFIQQYLAKYPSSL